MKKFIVLILLSVLFLSFSSSKHDNFPVPTGIPNMLFYVQRSLNKNTIIYQLNTDQNEVLNELEPIKMYWVNYAGKGDREALNYIQKKYAYGIEVSELDKEKKTFCFNFVSYKKQLLYLIKSGQDKKYHVYGYFNNRLLLINNIYIHIEGGTFWTPKVKYIEVMARDAIKNEEVKEKIIIEKNG